MQNGGSGALVDTPLDLLMSRGTRPGLVARTLLRHAPHPFRTHSSSAVISIALWRAKIWCYTRLSMPRRVR